MNFHKIIKTKVMNSNYSNAIIFDLDGTLIDSVEGIKTIYKKFI